MKILIVVLFLLGSVVTQAQTKVIAHKSHSGSKSSFSKAYKNSLFDMNRSNFGLPGNENVLVLDSVIAVNDSVTIIKMRESIVCYPYGTSYEKLKEKDYKSKTFTVTNHELLFKDNPLKLIKAAKKNRYPIWFPNPIDEVVFIGFNEQHR